MCVNPCENTTQAIHRCERRLGQNHVLLFIPEGMCVVLTVAAALSANPALLHLGLLLLFWFGFW